MKRYHIEQLPASINFIFTSGDVDAIPADGRRFATVSPPVATVKAFDDHAELRESIRKLILAGAA